MIDLLLYKEALSACRWSTIKTEELEKLRTDLEEARKVINDIDDIVDEEERSHVTFLIWEIVRRYTASHPQEIPPAV